MYKSFDFDYNLIKKHYDKIKTTIDKIDYLEWIITEYKNSGQPHQTSIIIQKPNRSITAGYMGGEPLIRTIEIPSDQFIDKINNDLNLFKNRLEREKSTSTDITKAITDGKENSNTQSLSQKYNIKWNMSKSFNKSALVELIYALKQSGAIVATDTSQIVYAFEEFFNMKIDNYSQLFKQIRDRKKSSPTQFLDNLTEELNNYISYLEEEDEKKLGNNKKNKKIFI